MVSIITPCYNYGRFLAEAFESVLLQSYTDWECIVVNDGSADNTEEVALAYVAKDNRFKYFYQNNQGHAAARNNALAHSKGKYIQFLDADDMLEPEKLKLQVALMEENQEIDLVYSDILLFNHFEIEREFVPADFFKKDKISGKDEFLLNALVEDNIFVPGCVLMRKKIYDNVGNLKSSHAYEDWEFFSRAALFGYYFQHDGRTGTRLMARGHGNNATGKHQKMIDSKIKVREEIIREIKHYQFDNKSNLSSRYTESLINHHNIFLNTDNFRNEMFYGSLKKGLKFMLSEINYTGKPFKVVLNGFFWTFLKIKARIGVILK